MVSLFLYRFPPCVLLSLHVYSRLEQTRGFCFRCEVTASWVCPIVVGDLFMLVSFLAQKKREVLNCYRNVYETWRPVARRGQFDPRSSPPIVLTFGSSRLDLAQLVNQAERGPSASMAQLIHQFPESRALADWSSFFFKVHSVGKSLIQVRLLQKSLMYEQA